MFANPTSLRRSGGFTVVEGMIAMVLLATMMAAVWNATETVNTTVVTNSSSAEATSEARRTLGRISSFVRSGKLSTLAVPATQEDVVALRATAVGEWIAPTDLIWHPGVRFQSAVGLLSMNAALSTSPRQLLFTQEDGETLNGQDDDKDGLIDEGAVTLEHDSATVAVLRNVEDCQFMVDGRLLVIRLRVARRDNRQRVFRSQFQQAYYMRNN